MSPLRVFAEAPPEPGELVLARDDGGRRHFLDGKPVYCGTTLELLAFFDDRGAEASIDLATRSEWKLVRYESRLTADDAPALLYLPEASRGRGPAPVEVTTEHRLRWPPERPRANQRGLAHDDE